MHEGIAWRERPSTDKLASPLQGLKKDIHHVPPVPDMLAGNRFRCFQWPLVRKDGASRKNPSYDYRRYTAEFADNGRPKILAANLCVITERMKLVQPWAVLYIDV